jgi:dTDP-4-dehydrorhamnose reductase
MRQVKIPMVLITGSSGFLGRNLLKFTTKKLNLIAQYRNNPPVAYGDKVRFLKLDFAAEQWKKLQTLKPQVIIHTAAMASIDECETQPELAQRINYLATCRLVDFAAQHKIRFIFISSDAVFDGEKGNYSEEEEPHAVNFYAQTKIAAEKYVLENHPNAVVVRPALFYGLCLDGRPSFTEIMLQHLYAGKQIYAFTDQYRTPILVNNLVSALWELTENTFCGYLHLGGPQKVSRLDLGQILCDIFKLDESLLIPVKSQEVNLRARRPLDCSLNISLSQSLFKTQFVDCHTGLQMAYR